MPKRKNAPEKERDPVSDKETKEKPIGIPGRSYPRNAPEWDNMQQRTRK